MGDEMWHDSRSPLPPEVADLWETNARWWQESFTEGADVEYNEQIVPLLIEELSAAKPARVLDIGCGEGQLSRLAAGLAGVQMVAGVDPTWAQLTVALERQGPAPGVGAPAGLSDPTRSGSASS